MRLYYLLPVLIRVPDDQQKIASFANTIVDMGQDENGRACDSRPSVSIVNHLLDESDI